MGEPIDPAEYGDGGPGDELPVVELAHEDDRPPRRSIRTWWFVIAAGVVVVVGLTVGIVVFNSSAPDNGVDGRTAAGAARTYVRAVNAGDKDRAAAISCASFQDSARAAARSGQQGFRFTLERVRASTGDTAVATVRVALHVSGATQSEDVRINVFRDSGSWHVCGLLD